MTQGSRERMEGEWRENWEATRGVEGGTTRCEGRATGQSSTLNQPYITDRLFRVNPLGEGLTLTLTLTRVSHKRKRENRANLWGEAREP